jgi:nucleoside-diphosphate-sugar epimerase
VARVVLVTGAAGGMGRAVVPALGAEGWRVRCLVHRRPVPDADEAAPGDLAVAAGLRRAADGADAILHLAALTHSRRAADYDEVNVAGTGRLLEAARAAGVRRFVHVSTRAIDESGGAYSRSKAAAERLVEVSGLEWTVVRLPEVFGAGGAEGVDDIIARARRGGLIPLVGRGDDMVCPIHLDDATGALTAALSAPAAAGRVYTLAGECLTMRRFAETCNELLGGGRSRIVGVPVAALCALGVAARVAPLPLYPDQLARLRAPKPSGSPEAGPELGFAPRPLREALSALTAPGTSPAT